jgi:FecR protein
MPFGQSKLSRRIAARSWEQEGAIPCSRHLLFAMLGCGALAAGGGAYAQQNIGSTALSRNQVSREIAGAAGPLNNGDPVFRDEIVRTGEDSTAKLVFLDSTNLAIGPISRVTLDRFVYSGGATGQELTVNLAKGIFRFTTGALDKKAYTISTPTASIGVRGTVLDIDVRSAQSRVTLVEGQALVCPRKPGITFEQQRRNCSSGAGGAHGGHCDCVELDNAGQTATSKKAGGSVQASLTSTPVNFASLCAGGGSLCSAGAYASLSPIGGGGGGGGFPSGALCGH